MKTMPILNVADAPCHDGRHGDRFAFSMHELAGPLGAQAIGANVTRVPPGKAAFPFHHHRANEEHFFVLSGSGVLRVGHASHAVRTNDYIVNLPGGADEAHQLINTGAEDLVYLAISTQRLPEVVGYPDSGKTGVRVAQGADASTRFLIADDARNAVDYWSAEDGARVGDILRQSQSKT